MCTAITYKTRDFYFGRNLDYEFSYGEEVVIMPRGYNPGRVKNRLAVLGMAHTENDYPLFYDGVNEKGLCMAGLNFEGNAGYCNEIAGADNVAQYELIPRVLGTCENIYRARELLEKINLSGISFSKALPTAHLHWLVADKNGALTVEKTAEGLKIYENPVGVLANNPTFDKQLFSLNDFIKLSPKNTCGDFGDRLKLFEYSRGMGAIGLPGDWSSQSRFVRAAFVRAFSVSGNGEEESVGQVFHILESVGQVRGCCEVGDGKCEYTLYTSCCNADRGIYYYTTYGNHQITAIDMHRENLDEKHLIRCPLVKREHILRGN